jgi:hypothetical protein
MKEALPYRDKQHHSPTTQRKALLGRAITAENQFNIFHAFGHACVNRVE